MTAIPSRSKRFRLALALAFGLLTAPATVHAMDLSDVQDTLDMLGYHAGRSDGKPHPETVAALRQFQKAQKLSVTGKADTATVAALRSLRETKFSHQLGSIGGSAPIVHHHHNQVEPKPVAAPTASVAATDVGGSVAAVTGGGYAPALPPVLFGDHANDSAASGGLGAPAMVTPLNPGPGPNGDAAEPGLTWRNFLWLIPVAGLPFLIYLIWGGLREADRGSAFSTQSGPMIRRSEPNLGAAQPRAPGRQEPGF